MKLISFIPIVLPFQPLIKNVLMEYKKLPVDHPYVKICNYHKVRRMILAFLITGITLYWDIYFNENIIYSILGAYNLLEGSSKNVIDFVNYGYYGLLVFIGIIFVFRFSNRSMRFFWNYLYVYIILSIFYSMIDSIMNSELGIIYFFSFPLIFLFVNGLWILLFIIPREILNGLYNWIFSGIIDIKNLRGVDLSYVDLSFDYKLRYVDLEGANLEGSNLKGVDLGFANLKNVNLRDIRFNRLKLKPSFFYSDSYGFLLLLFHIFYMYERYFSNKTLLVYNDYKDLTGINLSNVNLLNTVLGSLNLTNANLTNTNLTGAKLVGINLTNANLTNTNLTGAKLNNINLTNANLTNTNLTYSILDDVNFKETLLIGTNFQNASFRFCKLMKSNIQRVNFMNSIFTFREYDNLPKSLIGLKFKGANLKGANLELTNLTDSDFQDANLSDANLTGSNLYSVNLTRANLSGANLTGADLSDANLEDSNLTDTDLSSSKLSGANLKGANVSRAKINNTFPNDNTWKETTGIPET